jgi:hypothetical protein
MKVELAAGGAVDATAARPAPIAAVAARIVATRTGARCPS